MTVTTPEEWLRKLMEVHAVQGREGNWNYSPYMRGMFNGLELALSIIQNEREPRYKEAPANYLSDDRDKAYPDYLSYKRADTQHTEAVTVYGIGINEWDRYQRMVQEIHGALAMFAMPVTALDADVDVETIIGDMGKHRQQITVVDPSTTPTAVLPRIVCTSGCSEGHTYAEGCVMAMTHPTAALPTVPEPDYLRKAVPPRKGRPVRDNPQA